MRTTQLYANENQNPSEMLRKVVGYTGRPFSRGVYGRVYWSQPLRRVIKVGNLSDSYLEYIKLIKREKSSLIPHVDKVIYCHDFDGNEHIGAYAVIMERLYHARTPKQIATRDLIIEAIDPEGCISLKLIAAANPRPRFLHELIRVARRITRKCESGTIDVTLDMHNDNVMFRSNGQAVITDPYS